MRILVTGGAGFIGSNLIHHLAHKNGAPSPCCPWNTAGRYPREPNDFWEILNLDALTYAANIANLEGITTSQCQSRRINVCDAPAVQDAVANFKPDAIFHLAAESHVDRSIAAGEVFARTNVLGTQVMLDAARRNDVAAFIHVSTDEVYGSVAQGSVDENGPLLPSSPYAASKAASDLLVQAHRKTYGLSTCTTRCTNNYGPRQHPEKLIPKMIGLAKSNKRLPIYGSGQQRRDWLHVADHCEALFHLLNAAQWGETFNIAGQNEQTNLEIAARVVRLAGGGQVEHVADRPGHDYRYSVDDSKLRSLGWSPRIGFEEGLKETVECFMRGTP